AFQATPTIAQGTVTIDRSVPNQDTITVTGFDAIVDWVQTESGGDALGFLTSGNTAVFQGAIGEPDFGIINRVLPDTNGNMALLDGTVISQLQPAGGPALPGGYVVFFSPTGWIVGNNSSFNIGKLLITSLTPDPNSFINFADIGGTLNLSTTPADTSLITIQPGASITGTEEGSAFMVVAPQIDMQGTADINGSTVYAAGEVVNLTMADGLFDIQIPLGTTVAS
ncbi:MAG: hypothetical protein GWN87_17055, partial [Desulfuromonadales bacterium]|nr:hypothetical protein [Desulfuromonadales bacterium]